MKQSSTKKVIIGVLTQPLNELQDSDDYPDQMILHPIKDFIEANNQAVAVPIRYDLRSEPEILRKTLDSVDGVLFPGGFLSIRFYS
jgi:gamma-glutamyl-gamma-aminobutyrate hydrolase PuuD